MHPGTSSPCRLKCPARSRIPRHTPTVFNSGWQFAQFRDGRAADLAEQATGPELNQVEMAMPDAAAVRKMAYLQLDRKLTEQQIEDITAFLNSLAGKILEKNKP